MVQQTATYTELLAELDEHGLVEAAVVVDAHGAVEARVGSAAALASDAGGTRRFAPATDDAPGEDAYIRTVGADFLVVLFADDVDFDRLKSEVDELVEASEL